MAETLTPVQEALLRATGAVPVGDDVLACRYGFPPGWGIVSEPRIVLYRRLLLAGGRPVRLDKWLIA